MCALLNFREIDAMWPDLADQPHCEYVINSRAGTRLRQARQNVGNEVFIARLVSNCEIVGRQIFHPANEFTCFACVLHLRGAA